MVVDQPLLKPDRQKSDEAIRWDFFSRRWTYVDRSTSLVYK